MDALLLALKNVCDELLPILGVVALVFLSILLFRLAKLVVTLNDTVKSLSNTIKLVDTSMEKVQAPLDSAVKISHSVDEVHDASYKAIKNAGTSLNENVDTIKKYVNDKVSSGN